MKTLSIFALSSMAVALAPAAYSADFGFGASLKSNKSTIYMPINISGWIIEPSLQFTKADSSRNSPTINNSSNSNFSTPNPFSGSTAGAGAYSNEFESESLSFGVGVFKESVFEKGFSAYYGARLGYMESEYNSTYTSTSSGAGNSTDNNGVTSSTTQNYQSVSVDKSKDDGYFITPTLGIKYSLKENFSISLESSFIYSDLSGSSTNSYTSFDSSTGTPATIYNTSSRISSSTGNGKSKSSFSGTQQTDIVFRYMF